MERLSEVLRQEKIRLVKNALADLFTYNGNILVVEGNKAISDGTLFLSKESFVVTGKVFLDDRPGFLIADYDSVEEIIMSSTGIPFVCVENSLLF